MTSSEWYAANRDRARAQQKEYRERNRAAIQARRKRNKSSEREQQLRKKQARRTFLQRWKLAAGCVDCGYAEHPAALDFDHVIDEKKFTISGPAITRSFASVRAELNKCVVRCSNCHRVKTHKAQGENDE